VPLPRDVVSLVERVQSNPDVVPVTGYYASVIYVGKGSGYQPYSSTLSTINLFKVALATLSF
jgi:hypothetical protein